MQAPLSAEAVRDTLAAVFRDHAYARGTRATIWHHIVSWLDAVLSRLFAAIGDSAGARWTARVLLVTVALLVAGRLLYLAWAGWQERGAPHRLGAGRLAVRGAGDPWQRAQREAAAGRYTEAAHLLYQALLTMLAGRERLRLHESKTVGDYARELRARSSTAFEGFRDFARVYETVVYGLQYCDRERYERLRALALALGGPRG
ncbi:MAG TPA: DUF4129 domain-containing protein [Gemmatimonadaceae bacterium]|nr:DUF4129 domain-containing protein [Gemmatimonadaceae bacterium]